MSNSSVMKQKKSNEYQKRTYHNVIRKKKKRKKKTMVYTLHGGDKTRTTKTKLKSKLASISESIKNTITIIKDNMFPLLQTKTPFLTPTMTLIR